MTPDDKPLRELIHGVRSKAATLADGAEGLRDATSERRQKLLSLMKTQAQSLVDLLDVYRP